MSGRWLAESLDTDRRAIDAIGAALEGSGKPFVGTNASPTLSFIGGITDRPATEEDVLPGGPRADSENAVIALAGRGVRSSVVRLPPLVRSELDRGGLLPGFIGIARAQGVSGYVADGANRWPAVHTLDAARLYRLAAWHAPAGSRLHAVAEDGIPFRETAEAIARKLDIAAASRTPTSPRSSHWTTRSPVTGPGSCSAGSRPARPWPRISTRVSTSSAELRHRTKFAAVAGTASPCRPRRQARQLSWAKVARMSRTRVSGCSRAKKCPPAAGSLKKTTLA